MYTSGQAAYDLAVLGGWFLAGVFGALYYWYQPGQGIEHGCAPSGSLCE